MTPMQLLKIELDCYIKALKKSKESCINGKISIKLHTLHLRNLIPLIKQYKQAINKLK